MSYTRREFILAAAAGIVAPGVGDVCSACPASSASPLKEEFAGMPDSSRMTMHWYIFGPAWTVEDSCWQLQQMKNAHVGGVLIFPTYPIAADDSLPGVRNQRFLSPEYLQVYRAVTREAGRLGMRADVVLGTGWPYGGPTVAPEDSAHRIRQDRLPVRPGGRPRVPSPVKGGKIIAAFYVHGRETSDITSKLGEDDLSALITADGEIQIYSCIPTNMQVKRAALGAEGLIVDHYNRLALEKYLAAVGKPIVDNTASGARSSVFCDSLEVYRATWTPAFPEAFRRKRGYDLVPHLPALFDDSHPDARDLRFDFWRSLSEMAVEEFVAPLQAWAAKEGVTTQVEAYGTPPVSLAAYQYVDVPTGEHYEWKEFCSSRWASSGGHLAGKRVILAEAWTWLGLPNRFADTMEQLKLCSDLHFLCGINAIYGVTYAYSPRAAGSPGWVPYFGPHVNHTVPFWPYFQQLADYINRASHLLQQGKPVADIALYLPTEDCMADGGTEQLLLNWATRDRMSSNGPPPEFSLKNALHYESNVVKGIVANGYAFDGIDLFVFATGVDVAGGRLRKGDGEYSTLVLPALKSVDLPALQQIAAFVREGGTLIAVNRLPETAAGMKNRETGEKRVKELVRELFGPLSREDSYKVNKYGRGVAIFAGDDQGSYLKALSVMPPDVRFSEPCAEVGFVHRRTRDHEIYFLANVGEDSKELDLTFRVGRMTPEFWDPHAGRTAPAAIYEHKAEGTRLPVRMGPFGSVFVVFSHGEGQPLADQTNLPQLHFSDSGWKAIVENSGRYFLKSNMGRRNLSMSDLPAPVILNQTWRLSFDDKKLQEVTLDRLQSWTELGQARFFSGKGTYETEFEYPQSLAGSGLNVRLDLGRVHETADVIVNGQPAGLRWMRPYTLDIGRHLRPGSNRLRIEVTNLLINKILGMGPIDYSAVFAQYGRRFSSGDEWTLIREPFLSGLLGPVRLIFGRELAVL